MPTNVPRWLTVSLLLVAVFAASAAVLSRLIPGPHSSQDQLIIGTMATFIALVVLFAILGGIAAWRRLQRHPGDR